MMARASLLRRVLYALALMVPAAAISMAHAASNPVSQCPDFPTMKAMHLQSVASNLNYNGIPMSITGFSSADDPQTVLAFYRSTWAGAGPKGQSPVEYPLGAWQVIAMMLPPCFYTVQVKANGKGSEGLLGLTASGIGKIKTVKEDVPMLPGSRVANDIVHNDGGKTGRTLLLKNGFSVQTNIDFYVKNLGDQGWKVISDYQGTQHDTQAGTIILQQGVREVSITITQQTGKSSIVLINYMDQP